MEELEYKKPFYTLEVGDEEYHLKLTNKAKVQAEEKLGFSMLECLGNKSMYTKTFVIIMWAALQKFHANMNLDKVYELCDKLDDMCFDSNKRYDIMYEIFKVSGFFTKEELAKMHEKEVEEEEAKKTQK